VSVPKAMITEMRHADNDGHLEHKRKFSTRDLAKSASISKATARRIMIGLQVLGIVKIGTEKKPDGKYNNYVELVPELSY
jgi:predicted transcriptional regulator